MNTYRLTFKCGHARDVEGPVAPTWKSAYCFECKPGGKVMKPLTNISQVLPSGDVVDLGAPVGVARGHHRDWMAGASDARIAAATDVTPAGRKARAAARLARIDAMKAEAAQASARLAAEAVIAQPSAQATDPVSEAAIFALINGEDPIAAAVAAQKAENVANGVAPIKPGRHARKDAEAAQGAAPKASKPRKATTPKADRVLSAVK